MSGASRSLAVVAVALPITGLGFWLLADAPTALKNEPSRSAPAPTVTKTTLDAPPPPPTEDATVAQRLEARLRRAVALTDELEPAVASLLATIAADAERAALPGIAADARRELAHFETVSRARDLETAKRTREEARALARELSPAAISRFAEAIALATSLGDVEAAKTLGTELEAFRFELRSRAAVAAVDRERAGQKDDGTTDEDAQVRTGFERLARGDASAEGQLVKRLADRADSEHRSGNGKLAVRDYALARSAIEQTGAIFHDERHLARYGAEIMRAELACRLEEAGVGARRADGPAALALLDMAELRKLEERAPRNVRVLYLHGRALEADGRPDEARRDYEAAIGTATWLAADPPIELVRWFARLRAKGDFISAYSPGVGDRWRRIVCPHCVVFEELGEAGLGMGGRVERARGKAVSKLGLGEPIRLQSIKPVVFVYASQERYQRGAAPSIWAGGHAQWEELEDGLSSAIVTYSTAVLEDVLAHEWTHVVVNDAMKGARLPSWAVEGVACWVEEGEARKWRLKTASRNLPALPSWETFLATRVDRRYVGSDTNEAGLFYAQALLAFETAVPRAGGAAKVLAAASKIANEKTDPFAPLGFKDEEDFGKAAGVVLPTAKK